MAGRRTAQCPSEERRQKFSHWSWCGFCWSLCKPYHEHIYESQSRSSQATLSMTGCLCIISRRAAGAPARCFTHEVAALAPDAAQRAQLLAGFLGASAAALQRQELNDVAAQTAGPCSLSCPDMCRTLLLSTRVSLDSVVRQRSGHVDVVAMHDVM